MYTSETNVSVMMYSNKKQEKLANSIILKNIVNFVYV